MSEIYCTSYCNFGHRMRDGKPIEHECAILPPAALRAERAGDIETARQLIAAMPHNPITGLPLKMMRRGVRRA